MSSNDSQRTKSHRRELIETLSEGFEAIGIFTFDHRWVVLSLCLALLGICIYSASSTRFDNSFTSYFIPGDPIYQSYLDYRDEFGSEEISYLVYEVPDRPHGAWDLDPKLDAIVRERRSKPAEDNSILMISL